MANRKGLISDEQRAATKRALKAIGIYATERQSLVITPEVFKANMQKFADDYDTEGAHSDADKLMCELLTELGYGEGVEIFKRMERWYA